MEPGLRDKFYTSCECAVGTYGAETWAHTRQANNKLAAAQTQMVRNMLNITYRTETQTSM